eukprot:gene5419-5961_t
MESIEDDDEDKQLIELIHKSEEYLKIHRELAKLLSDGCFAMTVARKSGSRIASVDDLREDFDAQVLLVSSNESEDYSLSRVVKSDDDKDEAGHQPLLLISALPPPALKTAQKHFQNILSYVLLLQSMAQKIIKATPGQSVDKSVEEEELREENDEEDD